MGYSTTVSGEASKMKREAKIERETNVEKFYESVARTLSQDPNGLVKEAIKQAFYQLAEMHSPQQAQYMILKLMSDSYKD